MFSIIVAVFGRQLCFQPSCLLDFVQHGLSLCVFAFRRDTGLNTPFVSETDLLSLHYRAQVGGSVQQKLSNGGVHDRNYAGNSPYLQRGFYRLQPPNIPPSPLLITLVSTL